MNASRIIINMFSRSYRVPRGSRQYPNPGVQNILDGVEAEIENNVESIENSDLEDMEPDFMQAHKSYSSHKKELTKSKDLLKLRIVTRKYFKEVEPSLLTYTEKEQIRFLHNRDPVEYTPEKLSESFPALAPTIRKILKAKWTPKSAERVMKHDQQVIENWKKFKRGELPLEPRLREHLQRYKGRRISLPNKEELEKKLIPPEKTFVKPKSQLYSGIIQSYLDQNKDNSISNSEETVVSTLDKNNTDFKVGVDNKRVNSKDLMDTSRRKFVKEDKISRPKYTNEVALLGDKESSKKITTRGAKDFLTLDKFFEDRVKHIDGTSSLEDRVLVDTYKKKTNSDLGKEESISSKTRLQPTNVDAEFGKSDSVTLSTDKDVRTALEECKKSEDMKVIDDSKEMGLETYVKLWEKKASQDEHYPQTIIIPKNKYAKEKLYKVRDCYYDHDGEFLYRVPGLGD